MTESMTPKERITAFFNGQAIDHVPCVPLILNHAARIAGINISRYATDGEAMARAHVAAYEVYRHDLVTLFSDTAILAEAMGTRLYLPDDDAPRVRTPFVAAPQDVAKLQSVDVRTAGRLPVHLTALRRCVADLGHEVLVAVCYAAPFTTAACLRGTALFARDLYKNRPMVFELLEKSAKVAEDFAEAVVEAGGVPVLVDPVASGSVISRAMFEEFALPYITRVIGKIRALGMPGILHICGRTSRIIDLMAETGALVLSVDQIELREAKEKVGHLVCLMGNVRPTEALLDGTPESVSQEAQKCLEDCADNPRGFILASGCEVPINAPPANVVAMLNVARHSGLAKY